MLLASGGGLIMADHISFSSVYMIMGACMLPGIVTTIISPEPENPAGTPKTIQEAVILPLKEYFSRTGAWWILGFIFLYKIGDTMASAMTTPFYLDIGFSKTEIGAVVKLFGFWATIVRKPCRWYHDAAPGDQPISLDIRGFAGSIYSWICSAGYYWPQHCGLVRCYRL